MNRLIGVLFVSAATCSSLASAQEQKHATPPPASFAQTSEPGREVQAGQDRPSSRFKPEFRFDITPELTEAQSRDQQVRRLVFISPPRHVFKDGALYLEVLGNGMLVPVPGGGASGCFDWNLLQRIEKLKTVIETLPTGPASNRPRK